MPTETEQTSRRIKNQYLSSRRVRRDRGCNRRVYDTAATAIANRYWTQVALSTKTADASHAAVPSRGGCPARLAHIETRNTTLPPLSAELTRHERQIRTLTKHVIRKGRLGLLLEAYFCCRGDVWQLSPGKIQRSPERVARRI